MSARPKAVVVLPTYNEAENLPVILPRIFKQQQRIGSHDLHVLVVDDNSPDGSADIVRKHMSAHENLHLITGMKKGLGRAYKRGIDHAIEKLEADLIFEMDADLQHDPAMIPLFIVLAVYGFSVVIGSRFVSGAATPEFSLRRRLMSLVGNWMLRFLAGLPAVHDYTSGYRCIKADLIKKCSLNYLSIRGYSFQSAFLFELIRHGAKIVEIPITFGQRVHGESKLAFLDQLEFLANIWKFRFHKSEDFARFALIGGAGLIVNLGLYLFMTRLLSVPIPWAAAAAIEISIIFNYALFYLAIHNSRLPFLQILPELAEYHLLRGGGGIINFCTLFVLTGLFHVWDISAYFVGMTLGALVNYFSHSRWTWRGGKLW